MGGEFWGIHYIKWSFEVCETFLERFEKSSYIIILWVTYGLQQLHFLVVVDNFWKVDVVILQRFFTCCIFFTLTIIVILIVGDVIFILEYKSVVNHVILSVLALARLIDAVFTRWEKWRRATFFWVKPRMPLCLSTSILHNVVRYIGWLIFFLFLF